MKFEKQDTLRLNLRSIVFEVTLIQLNTYKSLVEGSSGNIYLFTDDLRFKEQFESQGIKVISPPGKS